MRQQAEDKPSVNVKPRPVWLASLHLRTAGRARGAAGQPPGRPRTDTRARARLGTRLRSAGPAPLGHRAAERAAKAVRRGSGPDPGLLLLPLSLRALRRAGAGASEPAALPARRPRARGVAPGGLRGPGHVRAAALPGPARPQAELAGRGLALPPGLGRFRRPRSGGGAGRGRGRSWGRARGGGRRAHARPLQESPGAARRRPGRRSSADRRVGAAPSALAVGEGARGDPPEPGTALPSRWGLGLSSLPASSRALRRVSPGACGAFKTFKRRLGGN